MEGRERRIVGRRMSSVFAAREGRCAASEEIRLLQQRKADASVRVAGERLRCAAVLVPFFYIVYVG